MANLAFWHSVMGDSDEEEADFEGFTAEDLVKMQPNEAESDLDFDWDEVFNMYNDESSGEEEEEIVLPPDRAWSSNLKKINVADFCEPIGPEHELDVGASPLDYFDLLVPVSFFETMAEETNRYTEQKQAEKNKVDPAWRPATKEEMRLYIAIAIMMGIHKLPRQQLYWANDDRLQVRAVSTLMSENRFSKLGQYLHLNDRTKFIPRGQPGYDPLFKIRPLIDIVSQTFSRYYKPDREVSIDEAMIKFNGRLHFKQCISKKPTPWGIKVWCCADPRNGYLLDFDVYTGKTNHTATGGLGHHIVTTVGRRYLGKNHQLFFDNFFTSPALVKELLQRKTYACGTCRVNRKGWPKDLVFSQETKKSQRMKPWDVQKRQNGPVVATAWQDKRTVSVLSSGVQPTMGTAMRQSGRGPRVEKTIPEPILAYNRSMGGVDLFDQQRGYYSVGRQCRKWWRYLFWFFMEAAFVNAFILFKMSTCPPPRSRKYHDPLYFRLGLYDDLVKGKVITKRQVQQPMSFAGRAISDHAEHRMIRLVGNKKNCVHCQRLKRHTPCGRGVTTVYGCTLCNVHLCKNLCFAQFHAQLLQ